jgi:hypothetical protein
LCARVREGGRERGVREREKGREGLAAVVVLKVQGDGAGGTVSLSLSLCMCV